MRRMATILAFGLCVGAAPALATDTDDVKEEIQEAGESVAEFAEDKRDEYRRDVESSFAEFGEALEEARESAEDAADDTGDKVAELSEKLEAVQRDTEREFDELGDAAEDRWAAFRTRTDKAVADLQREIEELTSS